MWISRSARSYLLGLDVIVKIVFALWGAVIAVILDKGSSFDQEVNVLAVVGHPYEVLFWLYVLPASLGSIWLWLYAGSGFLLKAARRFDIGFEWFNRKVDIEKKPLQSIGLVAGALVAVGYWSVVVLRKVL